MDNGKIPGKKQALSEIFTLMKANPDPEFIKNNLSKEARKQLRILKHEKRIRDSLKIIDFLNKCKINYVVIKGITLSFYDPSREYKDLDILVAKNDVEKTAKLLISGHGYEYYRTAEMDSLKSGKLKNMHDIALVHKAMIPVEIHYKLVNYLDQNRLNLLSEKIFLKLKNVRIPCQSKELQLLEVLLHNVYHHFFICDMEKWIKDLNIIIANYDINWNKFIKMLDMLDQRELAYLTLKFLMGNKAKLMLDRAILGKMRPASRISYLKKSIFIWLLYLLRDRLFPPSDILYKRFGIRPDSKLFFLSYPANWIRLPFAFLLMLIPEK